MYALRRCNFTQDTILLMLGLCVCFPNGLYQEMETRIIMNKTSYKMLKMIDARIVIRPKKQLKFCTLKCDSIV